VVYAMWWGFLMGFYAVTFRECGCLLDGFRGTAKVGRWLDAAGCMFVLL
jgi:hypothetical protein